MTLTRKERIESLAKTIYLSGCTAEDSIYQAKIFIDAIDALPDEPDHIAEINARVDEVFGNPDDAVNAAKKVELPGKWWAKDDWIAVCGDREFPMLNACDSDAMCEARNADMDAAREYWFRAGVEAAAKAVESRPKHSDGLDSPPAIVAQIRAIPTPSVD